MNDEFMCRNKFFKEDDKNKLMNLIINADCENEDGMWDFALELEHMSIMIRRNILEQEK